MVALFRPSCKSLCLSVQDRPTKLIPSQLPAVFQAEQVSHLHDMKWFRSNSYEDWFRRYQDIYKGFGKKLPAAGGSKAAYEWNNWVRHPTWSFAWADQEIVHYLESTSQELAAIQTAAHQPSWSRLKEDVAHVRQSYVPPVA